MTKATVGARYQVVIPRAERDKVGLKPHEQVQVDAREGQVIIQPIRGRGWRGIGRELAGGVDATDYVRSLRDEWEDRS